MSQPDDSGSGKPGGSESDSKIFKDPIHGTIEVSGLCLKIIDTPQFQRLRYLTQHGAGYFVYPGATHNRFEHSIGTYYLAGKFARILRDKQQGFFEEDEIKCIEIAGLCHDLGHGPFSHVFDQRFMPRVTGNHDWKHEDASVEMLEHLLNENDKVKTAVDKLGKNGSGLELIKDIILGGKPTKKKHVKLELVQEKRQKPFLYEIVANDKTGIDVDKWDYFARDCHMLGIKSNFDHDRYMQLARIIDVGEGCPRICARDKEANNLYDMFHTRMMLHRRACQHTVTIGVELMIVDALQKVDDIVKIPGMDADGNATDRKISDCIDDMAAYSKLNDSILQFVELPITLGTCSLDADKTKRLERARGILKRLRSRNLYKCVGKHILSEETDLPLDIEQRKTKILTEGNEGFKSEDFELVEMSFDYGKKGNDPISNVRFYKKTNRGKAFPLPEEKISRMLPKNVHEQVVVLYVKEKELEKAIASSFKRTFPDAEIPEKYDDESAASQG